MSSSPSTTPVKVLILGHSFVRRLRVHTVVNGMFNLNLSRKGHTIVFRGVGGLKFAPLLRNLRNFCASGFDVVVFDFGTNDLAEGCAVDILVDRVGAVVDTLLASSTLNRFVVPCLSIRHAIAYKLSCLDSIRTAPYIIHCRDALICYAYVAVISHQT